MNGIRCEICPHACLLDEGKTGFCGARSNQNGIITADSYGRVTAIALDPIEKKPLRRFYPQSTILSVGSYGCNFRCPFCQNFEISTANSISSDTLYVSPEQLIQKAKELKPHGNIGIAYTYNEPLIGYEYVKDCTLLAAQSGLKNVVVTNGYINENPLLALLPFIHAMNIDLKSFSSNFYQKIGGDLNIVLQTIKTASGQCHVEITTLIIPGLNDSAEEMQKLSGWISSINPSIPLHISRFFPCYQMADHKATPIDTIYSLADIARKSLHYVYVENC